VRRARGRDLGGDALCLRYGAQGQREGGGEGSDSRSGSLYSGIGNVKPLEDVLPANLARDGVCTAEAESAVQASLWLVSVI
jgi:hypothetical protein